MYQDDSITVQFAVSSDVLAKFQNVETLEKELERESVRSCGVTTTPLKPSLPVMDRYAMEIGLRAFEHPRYCRTMNPRLVS